MGWNWDEMDWQQRLRHVRLGNIVDTPVGNYKCRLSFRHQGTKMISKLCMKWYQNYVWKDIKIMYEMTSKLYMKWYQNYIWNDIKIVYERISKLYMKGYQNYIWNDIKMDDWRWWWLCLQVIIRFKIK